MFVRQVTTSIPRGKNAPTRQINPPPITFSGPEIEAKDNMSPGKPKSRTFRNALLVGLGLLTAGTGIGVSQFIPAKAAEVSNTLFSQEAKILDMTGQLYKAFETGRFAFRDAATQKSYIVAPQDNDQKMIDTLKGFKEGDQVKVKTKLGGGLNMTQWGPYTTLQSIEKASKNQAKELNLRGTIYQVFDDGRFAMRDERTNKRYVLQPEEGNDAVKKDMEALKAGDRIRTKVLLGAGLNMTQNGPVVSVESLETIVAKSHLKLTNAKLFKVSDTAFNQRESYLVEDEETGTLYRIGKEDTKETEELYKQLAETTPERVTVTGDLLDGDTPSEPGTLFVREIQSVKP